MESKRQKTFKPLRIILSVSIVLLLILLLSPAYPTAYQFKVVRVTDGDTIKLRSANSKSDNTIRLVGIAAPETSKKKNDPGQPFGQTATKHPAGLVLNKSVAIKSYGTERFAQNFLMGKDVIETKMPFKSHSPDFLNILKWRLRWLEE